MKICTEQNVNKRLNVSGGEVYQLTDQASSYRNTYWIVVPVISGRGFRFASITTGTFWSTSQLCQEYNEEYFKKVDACLKIND